MMFGLLLGTVCLTLLLTLGLGARRRFAYAHFHGHHRGHCGSHGHHHGHRWGHRDDDHDGHHHRRRGPRDRVAWLGGAAARRLNLDEHQRDVVEAAMKQADKAARTFTEILDESRDELADAVKGEQLDQARLDAVFEKWDESLVEARKDVVDALRRAHAALEPDQRRRLAEWIGVAGWRR